MIVVQTHPAPLWRPQTQQPDDRRCGPSFQLWRTQPQQEATHTHTHTYDQGLQEELVTGDSWRLKVNRIYLWGEVRQPDAADQTEPLAEGLCLVEGQHGLPHLTAVTDWNIGHELHPSRHNSVTLACGNQTNGCRGGGWRKRQRSNKEEDKQTYRNDKKTHLVSCCDPPSRLH